MNIRNKLTSLISAALSAQNISYEGEIPLDYPADFSMGDFATPIAMKLAKELGQKPQEIAQQITSQMEVGLPSEVEKVEVAGPGFINVTLSKSFWSKTVAEADSQGEKWGGNNILEGKQVITEFTDPNPFKALHVGHVMSNAIGESISRIAEASGAEVVRCNYQGDVGMHVASAIWGIQKLGIDPRDADRHGEAYVYGASAKKENEASAAEIKKINKLVYSREDSDINTIYDIGRQASLDRFEDIYKILGTSFKHYFFESQTAIIGKEIVEQNPDVFPESDGARIFEGEKHGLHTRVFINNEDLPTYEAKELGLEKTKHDLYPNALTYVIITGNEINEYFKVLIKAFEQVLPEITGRVRHIGHGMMKLSSGKMSSRTGKIVTGEDMIFGLRDMVLEKMTDREVQDKEMVAQKIAVAATKYSVLRVQSGKDIVFDEEESVSFEGDTGPYIQYAYVRAVNAVKQAEQLVSGLATQLNEVQLRSVEVPVLERMLVRFPDMVERSLRDYSPHHIAGYIYELAQEFNSFYAQTKIADASNPDLAANIALVKSVAQTLQNGLWLLGIDTVKEM